MKVVESITKHCFISCRASQGELFVRDDGGYVTLGRITHRNEPAIQLDDREIVKTIKLLLKIRAIRKSR